MSDSTSASTQERPRWERRLLGSGTNPHIEVKRIRAEFDAGKSRWGVRDVAALLEMHDYHEFNSEESNEIEARWAKSLDEIAEGLPDYHKPTHDPNCAGCTIGRAIDSIGKHLKGIEYVDPETVQIFGVEP